MHNRDDREKKELKKVENVYYTHSSIRTQFDSIRCEL